MKVTGRPIQDQAILRAGIPLGAFPNDIFSSLRAKTLVLKKAREGI